MRKSGVVDIIFRTRKLESLANSRSKAQKKLGTVGGDRYLQRLEEIRASEDLAVLMTLPNARCHLLKGRRAGQFGLNLEHPYRLIIEPANNPLPTQPDGGIATEQVTIVRVIEIKDYHNE